MCRVAHSAASRLWERTWKVATVCWCRFTAGVRWSAQVLLWLLIWVLLPALPAGLGYFCGRLALQGSCFTQGAAATNSYDMVIPIIYAAVAAFVAMMIPIHYTLSVTFLESVSSADAPGHAKEHSLRCYVHTAEALVYAFSLFGASTLMLMVCIVAERLHVKLPSITHTVVAIAYALMLILGLYRNWVKYVTRWKRDFDSKPLALLYYLFYGYAMCAGSFWVVYLNRKYDTSNEGEGAVIALGLLVLFYVAWVLLRAAFAPMTAVQHIRANALLCAPEKNASSSPNAQDIAAGSCDGHSGPEHRA